MYPPATPSDAESNLVGQVRSYAVARGLPVPHNVRVEWYSAGDEPAPHVDGFTLRTQPPTVQLRVNLKPRRLIQVTLHELLHAADLRYPHAWSVAGLEHRAEKFAATHLAAACRACGVR